MDTVLMEVKNLTTRFYTEEGVVNAVTGVSYTLHEGETLGIVGESGSGKTVHALSILGLIPKPPGKIDSGEVIFRGRDLLKLSERKLRLVRGAEIATIFQDPMTSLNPVLPIGYQIVESLKTHLGMPTSIAQARAVELLSMVGISQPQKQLGRFPHQFSGGMRQRVMIAIGLSCNPSVLIADEPTTALDVTVQAQILDLVRRLRDTIGMAMLWISHDLGVVAGLADTVQVMYAGYIVERGAAKDVYGDPRHPYTIGLLGSLPRLDRKDDKLFSIEGSPPDMRFLPQGCPFSPRCSLRTPQCDENPPLLPVEDGSEGHIASCWVDVRASEVLG